MTVAKLSSNGPMNVASDNTALLNVAGRAGVTDT